MGKSAGAASGPKTICMTCSRLRIDIGINSVQAISLRISALCIVMALNTGETTSGRWVSGAISASPPTRAG
ncbi:hypothetical protein D3C85_1775330 [compost metagenome]